MNKNQYITKTFTHDGKRYYVRGKTEKEAYKKLILKQKEVEDNAIVISGNMTFKEWSDLCFENHKLRTESTQNRYNWTYEHFLLPEMANYKMKSILPLHCNKVMNSVSGLSSFTISQVYSTLKYLFDYAKINHVVAENPMDAVLKPKGTKTSRRAMNEEEEKAFLEVIQDERYLLFSLMYYCGCRPAEAKKAKSDDIKIVDDYPLLHIRGTKTANADRLVPIPFELYQKIKNKSGYLVTTESGKPYDESAYKRAVNSLKRNMNIALGCKVYRNELIPPYPLSADFCPYSIRHTYCTNLAKDNIDIRIAQKLMGHSDIKLTANIYTTVDNSMVLSAANVISQKVQQ